MFENHRLPVEQNQIVQRTLQKAQQITRLGLSESCKLSSEIVGRKTCRAKIFFCLLSLHYLPGAMLEVCVSVYEWKERAAEVTLYRSPQHSQTLHTMQPHAPPSQCLVCQFLNKPLTQVYNDGYSQTVYILVVLKNDNFFRGGISSFSPLFFIFIRECGWIGQKICRRILKVQCLMTPNDTLIFPSMLRN